MEEFEPTPSNIIGALRALRHVLEEELTKRERKVLEHRLGIAISETATFEDVGKIFGVTRERIRQIETKALEKLSVYLKEQQSKVKINQ